MAGTTNIPVFIINLERDAERRTAVLQQFASLPEFEPHVISGLNGQTLSDNVCIALTQDSTWVGFKGTLGCFLSHVKAWDEVAKLSKPYAVVLEDDVNVAGLSHLPSVVVPTDADVIFLNDKMSPIAPEPGGVRVLPIRYGLEHLDAIRIGPGGYGYLLTAKGARAMLAACLKDLYFGHVDGRLLQYATSEADLAGLPGNSWIANVIRRHHHPRLAPTLGLVRGYCLSRPLVTHRGEDSTREAEDVSMPNTLAPSRIPVVGALVQHSAAAEPRPLPIRFWNRTRNIGDLLNPHIIEAVSGRRPYYCVNENVEHILGIGSIFFMATPSSHIWGAGILNPTRDYSQIDVSKVHAVRGKLTLNILKERHGLMTDVPLGDPAIFADELPDLALYRERGEIKRSVGIIPHYAMENDAYIRELARELDADILSPRTDSLEFIKEVIASEILISQSLHGLIFAEIFGKPSTWLARSADDIWAFKFHDWYSNTIDPPRAPALYSTRPRDLVSAARLSGLSIDKMGLREALPGLPPGDHKPGVGFRECRRRSPFVFRVTEDVRAPSHPEYDATFRCRTGDEQKLRQVLNSYSRGFDEAFSLFLVFDPDLYSSLRVDDIRRCCNLLTDMPNVHYIGIPSLAERIPDRRYLAGKADESGIEIDEWQPSYNWKGAILVRHPVNFTFSAPGYAVFQS
jgi:hypothetical protein